MSEKQSPIYKYYAIIKNNILLSAELSFLPAISLQILREDLNPSTEMPHSDFPFDACAKPQ